MAKATSKSASSHSSILSSSSKSASNIRPTNSSTLDPNHPSSPVLSEASFKTAPSHPASPTLKRSDKTRSSTPKHSSVHSDLESGSSVAEFQTTSPPTKRQRHISDQHPDGDTTNSATRHSRSTRNDKKSSKISKIKSKDDIRLKKSSRKISTLPTNRTKPRDASLEQLGSDVVDFANPENTPEASKGRNTNTQDDEEDTRPEDTPIQSIEMASTISTAHNIPHVSNKQSLSTTLAGAKSPVRAQGAPLETREAQQAQLAKIFAQEQEEGERRRQVKLAAVNRFNEAFIRESSREKSQSVERQSVEREGRRPSLPTLEPPISYSSSSREPADSVTSPRGSRAPMSYQRSGYPSQPLPSPPLSYSAEHPPSSYRNPYQSHSHSYHAPSTTPNQRKRSSSPKNYYYTAAAPSTSTAAPPLARRTSSETKSKSSSGRRSSASSKKMFNGPSGPVYSQDLIGLDSSHSTPSASSTAARPMARVRMYG